MNGGNVVVFPHQEANLSDYNNLTKQFNANNYGTLDTRERKVSFVNFECFLLSFLITLYKYNSVSWCKL